MWSKPYGMKEGFLIGGGLIITGLMLQLGCGPIDWNAFRWPVNGIVLAGFLPLVPNFLIDAYPHKIINIHPALLPKYGGKGMWGHHVHEAVKAAGETETGMTVHWVTPVCDAGEIIVQYKVALSPDDTVDDIAEKEHQLEMEYFPKVVEDILKK